VQRRGGGRGLGAVLFTDIVGSTAIAAELGNARWSELVARHHLIVRRELRRFRGREIDTAGDGFFATFERPVDAIRCASAAADAVREVGIEIRAGVSFGELETVGRKPGGLVVNTAARVMSVAGPGEILIPGAVKDLIPGAGISFADHGVHQLKGLEGEFRLFKVTEVDGAVPRPRLDPEAAAERRSRISPPPRRRFGALVAGIAAAILVVGGVWLLGRDDEEQLPPAVAAASRGVVELDPETGDTLQTIDFVDPGRLPNVGQSYEFEAGEGAVWAESPANFGAPVFHVDPEHGEVDQVRLPSAVGTGFISMVTAFDALWATTDRLVRVNPATDEARSILDLPPPLTLGRAGLAADRQNLWLGTPTGTLLKLDRHGEEIDRRDVEGGIQLVAVGEGWVWLVDQGAGVVTKIDGKTLGSVAETHLDGNLDAIVVLDGYVWILDFGTGVLTRISTGSDRETGQETLPADPTAMAAGAGAIWVSHEDGTVTRVDPATMTTSEFARVGRAALAVAVDDERESIWVYVGRTNRALP
jgi:class 3 adenylate cyclase/streptogramin lyase